MCVGITLALSLLLLYYMIATLSELSLYEQIGEQSVLISEGTGMMLELWPILLFGTILGVLLTLIFLKFKKVI